MHVKSLNNRRTNISFNLQLSNIQSRVFLVTFHVRGNTTVVGVWACVFVCVCVCLCVMKWKFLPLLKETEVKADTGSESSPRHGGNWM